MVDVFLSARRINDTEMPWAVINPNGPLGDYIVAGSFRTALDAMLFMHAKEREAGADGKLSYITEFQ